MEMTTPVYSTAGQADAGKMSFPIEEKEGNEPQDLPVPNDARQDHMYSHCLSEQCPLFAIGPGKQLGGLDFIGLFCSFSAGCLVSTA